MSTDPPPTTAAAANRRLARTLNIGPDLGAERHKAWTTTLDDRLLDRCRTAGFTALRLPVALADHRRSTAPDHTDPEVLAHIERIVTAATRHGLAVVVANFLDAELVRDPSAYRARLLTTVRGLAGTLKAHGPDVLIEPFAEPSLALDPLWNDYLAALLAVVREEDPARTVVVGPRTYNNARFLPELSLPAGEDNVIVTIHQYWPIMFTMQGETWLGPTDLGDPVTWLGTTWEGSPAQRAELETGYAAVAAYGRAHNRPVFVGEFGTTNHADLPSRVRWTRFNRELAEHHGFAWSYWSYGPSFALHDAARGSWQQDLLDALIPPRT